MDRSLSTSWLSVRLGVDPQRLHALRRGGELLAFRPPGSQEYRFPAWQFDADWRPRPIVRRLVEAAREAGLPEGRLLELLNARVGLGGEERLVDLIRAGDDDRAVAAVRAAGTSA